MSEKETGGPAYPTVEAHYDGNRNLHYQGMDLRDRFAIAALQGFLGNNSWLLEAKEMARGVGATGDDYVAFASYKLADAMLEARKS